MVLTVSSRLVLEVVVFMRSPRIVRRPTIMPPVMVAVGMSQFNYPNTDLF